MSFQIRPLSEFQVSPALPASLARLPELAHNLLWSWDHNLRALFRRLDPDIWRQSHNPVLMLSRLPQDTLEKCVADARFMAVYHKACERLDSYMNRPSALAREGMLVAYFSMEYGIAECLPIYSGGLGVLSGDHLKGASDAGIPLVGVGLLYQKGYHQQVLNADGWQQERYPINEPHQMPVRPVLLDGKELKVYVQCKNFTIAVKVWEADIGRTKLYLLDTNLPENENRDNPMDDTRNVTENLYGGDHQTRIRQEIVLGIGGLRALKALGYHPTVFHMNEGHAAFLALERIRDLMAERRLGFDEAWEATRDSNVFTTHTCVPAGIDLFDGGMLTDHFQRFCHEHGLTMDQLFRIGRNNPSDPNEKYSMAVAAINTSSFRNAVSRLHGEVSQEMWGYLWPSLPAPEVPITYVTNGVHLPSMLNGDLAAEYDQHLPPDWRDTYQDPRIWRHVDEIPDADMWEAHRRRKKQLTIFAREHLVRTAVRNRAGATEVKRLEQVLDPEAFTIGFARRFATYKRATLLFRDPARLKRILLDAKMPVQIVISGKAHPKDVPGKTFIREIAQLSRDPELKGRVVFLENYSLRVAKEMVQGVDLWLNTPRRGEEACGTSGMKAALNGILNLSILDGWYDECYEDSGGWAIGDREAYSEDQDAMHASDIYSLLENEILPLYYARSEKDVPVQWVARMKQCLKNISPRFNTQRMLHEYFHNLYSPAHESSQLMLASGYEPARAKVAWTRHMLEAWPQVRFVRLDPAPSGTVTGQSISLRATLELGGMAPGDVKVQALVGRVAGDGQLVETSIVPLKAEGQEGSAFVFATRYTPVLTGRLGYTVRVTPNHHDDPLRRPCHQPIKWA